MIRSILFLAVVIVVLSVGGKAQCCCFFACEPVFSVAFSPDGRFLAGGFKDGTVRVWDVITGQLIKIFYGHTDKVNSIAFSPDGKFLASASDKIVRIVELFTNQEIILREHWAAVSAVSFSPNGRFLASASHDETLIIWYFEWEKFPRIPSIQIYRKIKHPNRVTSVAFSPDGQLIFTGSADKSVRIWNVYNGSLIQTFYHDGWVNSVSVSSDGKWIASAGDKNVNIWNVSGCGGKLIYQSKENNVFSVAFHPYLNFLAVAVGNSVKIFDLNGKLLKEFLGNANIVALSFSPTGTFLASGGLEGIRLWYLQ